MCKKTTKNAKYSENYETYQTIHLDMPHVQISHLRRPRHCLVLQRILEFSILMKVTMMMVMVLMLVLIDTGTGIGSDWYWYDSGQTNLGNARILRFFVRPPLPFGYLYH